MDLAELRFGRFRLDPARRVLLHDDVPVRIGPRAMDLLLVLVQRQPGVVSKRELFDLVWPDLVVEENNLQQHVSALRKLFGPQAIVTVPGRGYQFALRPDEAPPAAVEADDGAGAGRAPLPAPPPLIGRDADLAELLERLHIHPVVTLVGPGGIGKTRLALAAAHACRDRFRDGVWMTDLCAVNDGEQVASAVAHELAIVLPAAGDDAGRHAHLTVAAALRGQAMLLLLDNCEHVADHVAALIDALRRRAPQVRVLATSQEPLRVADEQILRLAPLDLPLGDGAGAEQSARSGAVQLFIVRAQAADRGFSPSAGELPAIVDICRRLDGLPLAIELAAARVPLLGLQGLRERLDERLRLLATRPGRGPVRQQTIRAALAWSHALLTEDERIVFRRLGVFAGGFSMDLAQRVLADPVFEPWAVLDHLGALVDKSLVMVDGGALPRYRLLESARAFALEQLERADEAGRQRLRHAQALGELLREFDRDVVHERCFDGLVQRIEAELDNLRAAMRWLADTLDRPARDADVDAAAARHAAMALAAHGDWLWGEVDPFGDGHRFCRLALGWLDDTVPPALVARLRLASQGLARMRKLPAADWAADVRLAVQGFRAAGDRVGLYRALCALGGATRDVVDDAEAAELLGEAQRLEDPQWSPRLRRRLQVSLEWWHDLGGRLLDSREAGRRNVALAREAGGAGEVSALGNLADTEFALGHVDEAIVLCRQAIDRAAELGRPAAAINAYENMVPALLERGLLAEAEAAIRSGRELLVRGLGSAIAMLVPLALLVHRRGDHRLAAQLLGCADHACAELGLVLHPPERRMREAVLAGVRPALGDASLATLVSEGARWSDDEAFARAGLG